MTTSNYAAAIDSSDLELSVAPEVTWGVTPAVAFAALRVMSESISEQKTRNRPQEINALGYAQHGTTTQVQASGDINFALSYGTFDALLAGMINGTWSTPLAIDGVGGDIAAVAATDEFTSSTSGKFTNVLIGQWIKVYGFTGNNLGFHRVIAKPDNQTLGVATALTNETPSGTDAKIRGAMVRNGVDFTSFHIQKKLATALFLNYAGSYISGGSINASNGDFAQGSVSLLCKSEDNNTSDQSTGSVTAAPAGQVVDTVAGVQNLQIDDAAVTGVIQSIGVTVAKNNARAQYGIGSADAAGMGRGTIQVDGTMTVYFANFTLYQKYKDEVDVTMSVRLEDNTGAAYVLTLPQVSLMNPQIVAGGPDTDVMANFSMEASQHATYLATIQFDKFDAAAA